MWCIHGGDARLIEISSVHQTVKVFTMFAYKPQFECLNELCRHHSTVGSGNPGSNTTARDHQAYSPNGTQLCRISPHSCRIVKVRSPSTGLFDTNIILCCRQGSHLPVGVNTITWFMLFLTFTTDSQYYVTDPDVAHIPVDELLSPVRQIPWLLCFRCV